MRLAKIFGQVGQDEAGLRRLALWTARRAGNDPDGLFDDDPQARAAQHLGRAQLGDQHRRADGGMARERQFACGREDAQPRRVHRIRRIQNEDRLRQIELPGDGLHGGCAEPIAIDDHRQRIAREGRVCENVQRMEFATQGGRSGILATGAKPTPPRLIHNAPNLTSSPPPPSLRSGHRKSSTDPHLRPLILDRIWSACRWWISCPRARSRP